MLKRSATSLYESEGWIRDRLECGLQTLFAASKYAILEESHDYEFAVEMRSLLQCGVNECDLRWLLSQSLVKHLIELTLPGDSQRTFRDGGASLADTSCFVLTDKGREFALDLTGSSTRNPETEDSRAVKQNLPVWDSDRRELWFCGELVKRFRLPSPNQDAVLSAFQEDNWPSRIDDPLPPKANQDPKRRLHDTIRNLNRSHRKKVLRFVGDGSGEAVLWETVRSQSGTG